MKKKEIYLNVTRQKREVDYLHFAKIRWEIQRLGLEGRNKMYIFGLEKEINRDEPTDEIKNETESYETKE